MNNFLLRISIDVLIVLSVLNGWWFFALPLAIFGAWRFSFFIEIILSGIAYDALFGFVPELGIEGYFGTLASVLIFSILFLFKKVARK